MIVIIDYGAGNLRSVVNAVKKLGYKPKVTSDGDELNAAPVVILPGVGAAGDTMGALKRLDLIGPIRNYINSGKPFLGICIGMQILFEKTEEGNATCLGIIPGQVKRLPPRLKVPHMGWNQVKQVAGHPVFSGIPDQAEFYFVHSYYPDPSEKTIIAGETEYGISFCSAIARENLVATQFHPEKSGEYGLKFYKNFIDSALNKR